MFRRLFSRDHWAIELLGLSQQKKPAQGPGLVMVQIDGLSQTQFNKALKNKHIPFLSRLLSREHYVAHTLYSGLPSNTPAVQAELMYGIKGCVPSFNFIDRTTGEKVKMFDAAYVEKFEARLKEKGDGLLKGGSTYSNILTGGAEESHFCFGNLGWSGVLHAANPIVLPVLIILYIDIFFRTFALLVIEFFIALYECIRGTLRGRLFSEELRFVWLRVMVCVFLREIVITGACMDIMRGLPVVHLNLLGYDEQAHCRGPGSAFAHWSLQGIDSAIKRLDAAIRRSPNRAYDLWVYSDHGQERMTPYPIIHGRTVERAIEQLFGSAESPAASVTNGRGSRASLLQNKKSEYKEPVAFDFGKSEVVVTAMGPLGQIYLKKEMGQDQLESYARRLVSELKIPLVMMRQAEKKVKAFTPAGTFVLPEQMGEVFGPNHPFLQEFQEDIIRICFHPHAGELIIAGWSQGSSPISFPLEYGGHAAMSVEETRAFALLPMDAPLADTGKSYLRPLDLREAALRHLKREKVPARVREISSHLRLMTYNVHGCKGMDGRISADRIARVLARYNPDIVCLQELDVGRFRSSGMDQAERIAKNLEMKYHFHPVFTAEEEKYGNAIISCYPLTLVKMGALPIWEMKGSEPRGAMWVTTEFQGKTINIINTHLSIWPWERMLQVKALTGEQWLNPKAGPTILCGDFNAVPGSKVYQKVCEKYKDCQTLLSGHRPVHTWSGIHPMAQIDHVFLTSEFDVVGISVPLSGLTKTASDHLPVLVDLKFKN